MKKLSTKERKKKLRWISAIRFRKCVQKNREANNPEPTMTVRNLWHFVTRYGLAQVFREKNSWDALKKLRQYTGVAE